MNPLDPTSERRPAAVRVHAPVRVADVGGWTDTWFGAPGRVCHLAVGPGVGVRARRLRAASPAAATSTGVAPDGSVRLRAPDVGLDAIVAPDADPDVGWVRPSGGGDPLLGHAVAAVLDGTPVPDGERYDLVVTAGVPPGASLGTSGAVLVAVIAALDALTGGRRSPEDLARLAHRAETDRAGRQAGVQDQWAAACGGAAVLDVNPYPSVARRPIDLDDGTVTALRDRLVTVVVGRHDSSAVHGAVVTDMVTCSGPGHDRARTALRDLARLAGAAASALGDGDLDRWGALLTEATETQRRLRPELVGAAHDRVIDLARAAGALGWKVNGAGGAGGSITVLARDAESTRSLTAVAEAEGWVVPRLAPDLDGVTITSLA